MRVQQIGRAGDERRFMIVLDTGDEVLDEIQRAASEASVEGATFSAIGALREATLAFWDPAERRYHELPVSDQAEVASLIGNVSHAPDGSLKAHAHAVLGGRDGAALAGHLLRGIVHPTLEIHLIESAQPMTRRVDEATGLPLLR